MAPEFWEFPMWAQEAGEQPPYGEWGVEGRTYRLAGRLKPAGRPAPRRA